MFWTKKPLLIIVSRDFFNSDIYQINNFITIYIDNYQITTTTLKAGYLIKESCDDNLYNFCYFDNKKYI